MLASGPEGDVLLVHREVCIRGLPLCSLHLALVAQVLLAACLPKYLLFQENRK
jgi:hypothetical protein